jgi:ribonuclease R
MGLPKARIVERLGDPGAPRAVSLIAIHEHGIPDAFPDAVWRRRTPANPPGLAGRTDLRDLPLVTIDPSDARDRDDAVHAHADDDPKNPGGHVIWVAIADVAHYVRPGSALDREARKRGNSTYFPDRVVPMLPDSLSGDLCSLHENVPRACLAVRMVIGEDGTLRDHRFIRGLMRSRASLEYAEVQAAQDGAPSDRTEALAGRRHRAALRRLWRAPPRAGGAPAPRPRPAGAAHRADRGRARDLRRLQGQARRAPDDRGVHGAGQCRGREGWVG